MDNIKDIIRLTHHASWPVMLADVSATRANRPLNSQTLTCSRRWASGRYDSPLCLQNTTLKTVLCFLSARPLDPLEEKKVQTQEQRALRSEQSTSEKNRLLLGRRQALPKEHSRVTEVCGRHRKGNQPDVSAHPSTPTQIAGGDGLHGDRTTLQRATASVAGALTQAWWW